MDVTHHVPFGNFKYFYVLMYTCSSFGYTLALSEQKAISVIKVVMLAMVGMLYLGHLRLIMELQYLTTFSKRFFHYSGILCNLQGQDLHHGEDQKM